MLLILNKLLSGFQINIRDKDIIVEFQKHTYTITLQVKPSRNYSYMAIEIPTHRDCTMG